MRRWIWLMAIAGAAATAAMAQNEMRRGSPWIRLQPGATVPDAELAASLLAETNRIRAQHKLRPLRPIPELNAAADDQARYMALRLTTTHENVFVGQETVGERVRRHGLAPTSLGENVASIPVRRVGDSSLADAIANGLVEAWLKSPGHRANLLSGQFTHVGGAIRLASGLSGVEYAFGAQVFATATKPDFQF
jgi:uncharacterized protein YkwD